MVTDDKQAAFWTAFLAAQREIQDLKHDATNDHFDSKYLTLHKLASALRPIFNRHDLVLTQAMDVWEDGKAVVRTRVTHKDGGYHEGTTPVVYEKLTAQAMVSGVTYARRAGLAAFACVAGKDEDDDGNAATEPAPKKQAAPAQARPASPPRQEKLWLVEEAVAAVQAAKTLPDLQRVHSRASLSNFQGEDRTRYQAAKDARKAELAEKVGT